MKQICLQCKREYDFLSRLRDAPKDVTPPDDVTERANRFIRERRARAADPFERCPICNKRICQGHRP